MVQSVALPDGNLINFPDEMEHDDIAKVMPSVYRQYTAKLSDTSTPKPEQEGEVHAAIGKLGAIAQKGVDTVGASSELGQIPNIETAKQLVKAPYYGAINAVDTLAGAMGNQDNSEAARTDPLSGAVTPSTNNYASTPQHQTIDIANTNNQNEINQTPYGGTAKFIGQAATTPMGPEAKLANEVHGLTAAKLIKGATIGAEFGAEQAKPATSDSEELTKQSRGTLETGALTGGITSGVLGATGNISKWFKDGYNFLTKRGTESAMGKAAATGFSPESKERIAEFADKKKAGEDVPNLDTTTLTQDPHIQSLESNLSSTAQNNLTQQRQGVNEQLSGEVKQALQTPVTNAAKVAMGNPEVNSTIASEKLSSSQKLEVSQAEAEVNKGYEGIDKGRQLEHQPSEDTKQSLTDINAQHGTDNKLSSIQSKYEPKLGKQPEESVPNNSGLVDSNGQPIPTTKLPTTQDTSPTTVGEQAADIVELRKQARSLFSRAEEGGDEGAKAYNLAQGYSKTANALEQDLINVQDKVADNGNSVGNAVSSAKEGYINFKNKYINNPDTGKIQLNADGEPMGMYQPSMGTTGKFMGRVGESEKSPEEEGKALLDSSKPGFRSAIKNFTNEDAVKDKILGDIKTAGNDPTAFEKYYSKPVQDAVQTKFPNAHTAIEAAHGAAILDDIKSNSIEEIANPTGKGTTNRINYPKYRELMDKNKDTLSKLFTPDELSTHDKTMQVLAQNDFALRGKAVGSELLDKNTPAISSVKAAVKSVISKVAGVPIGGAASTLNILDNLRAGHIQNILDKMITDPVYTNDLIKAAEEAPKDPSQLSKVISLAKEYVPAIAASQTKPTNVTTKPIDKEIGNIQNPDQVSNKNSKLSVTIHPIDKEVQDVTKPQSNNSNFSLVSDANAAEFGPGKVGGEVPLIRQQDADKKKGEFQIADASKATGVPEDYIKATEYAESHTKSNPDTASNDKSSALGRGQFIESTWNELANKHGLPPVTDANRNTPDDPRSNVKYSRLATGYYGADNAAKITPFIKDTLGRDTTIGDLYGAHVVGAGGFKKLMSADPNASAAKLMPAAAKNNPSLFYDKSGKDVNIRKWYTNIEDRVLSGIGVKSVSPPNQQPTPYSGTEGEPDE